MSMRSAGAVTLKRASEIDRMRGAGQILAGILDVLRAELRPGVSTGDLDDIAERMIRDAGAVPSFKGYGKHSLFLDLSAPASTTRSCMGSRRIGGGWPMATWSASTSAASSTAGTPTAPGPGRSVRCRER